MRRSARYAFLILCLVPRGGASLIVSFGFVVIAYTRFNNIVCVGVACLIIISSVVEICFVIVVLHVLLLRLCNDNVIIYMKYARCMH